MKYLHYIWFILPALVWAQDQTMPQDYNAVKVEEIKKQKVKVAEKNILREGNDLYAERKFDDAEVKYKKALQKNNSYENAYLNLGNAIYQQKRYKEALPNYELVAKTSAKPATKVKSLHNIGNVLMKQKEYAKAIGAYKDALRLEPLNEDTRYNLALAQKLLKDQQQNSENKNDQNKDQQQKEDQQKDQQKDQDNKDNKQDQGDNDQKDKNQDQGDNKDDQKDQNKNGQNEKDQQQPKPQPNKLSQQQMEQLLEAMNNEENKTQQKVNAKKARGRKVKQEKDW